jgi:hypothetical protein
VAVAGCNPLRHRFAAPAAVLAFIAGTAACVSAPAPRAATAPPPAPIAVAPLPPLPFPVDSLREVALGHGAVYRYLHSSRGPWGIHAVWIPAASGCLAPRALKGADGAVGRATTSELAALLGTRLVAAINADFFLFTPPGVPTGAHIEDSRLIAGPGDRPVLAFDQQGRATMTPLSASGTFAAGAAVAQLRGWNRAVERGVAVFDRGWGATTDTASGRVEVVLVQSAIGLRVALVDTLPEGVTIPDGGWVVVGGRDMPAAQRERLLRVRVDDEAVVEVSLSPAYPAQAVGGLPLLLRDSTILGIVDSVGQPGFATGRHPRTAVGFTRDQRTMILVVVDGRQPPYSDGMSLRELAGLFLALGARDAINLDGGGSSAMVIADRAAGGSPRVMNRPSDREGERPVANALAVLDRCGGG